MRVNLKAVGPPGVRLCGKKNRPGQARLARRDPAHRPTVTPRRRSAPPPGCLRGSPARAVQSSIRLPADPARAGHSPRHCCRTAARAQCCRESVTRPVKGGGSPQLYYHDREQHKDSNGRVRTGDQRYPVLCHCQLTWTRHDWIMLSVPGGPTRIPPGTPRRSVLWPPAGRGVQVLVPRMPPGITFLVR